MTVRRDPRRPGRPWIIDFTYKDTRTGEKKRYFRNALLQTADGARKEERRLLATIAEKGHLPDQAPEGEHTPPKPEMTFCEAVELYKTTLAQKLKPSTHIGYMKNVDAYLLPRFGSWPLSKIDRAAVTAFDLELARDELSASTRNNIVIPLRTIIGNAVELGHHDKKPDFPKLNRVKSKVYEPPSPELIDAVVAAADPHVRVAIGLAAYAGLRAGEVRGLRWLDVNLDSDMLMIRQTITHGQVVAPKSGHERGIPIAPVLKELLVEASKKPHKPTDPVAPSRKGTPWTESGLRGAFRRALDRAQVPATRLHGLRHFFITECFKGGASAPTVQQLAGHLHLSVTQRYAHTNENLKKEAVKVFTRRRT
ncbi:tyrosine-type recombinase/integrase [Polyangium aurulentum]|uniref:tyrosine-type recombinase/integrase n=1 Tax=Polyangium aurulentum TaxID=2567896 RepID=UPI001F45B25A|nr:site-specific integrase [Polyangium aurulentum]